LKLGVDQRARVLRVEMLWLLFATKSGFMFSAAKFSVLQIGD